MQSQEFSPDARVTIVAVRDGSNYKFWVYILSSRSGTLYVGITGYLARRIHQHKIDSIEGFTEKYQVHRLVYYEAFDHVMNAISREKQLKGWRRQKKIAFVETTNPRLARFGRTVGARNAVPGTVFGENALNLHFIDVHPRDVSTTSSPSLRLRST